MTVTITTTIEEAVRAFLLADADVQPYVAGGTIDPKTSRYKGNIWDQQIPQTFPVSLTVCAIGMKVLNQENERCLDASTRDRNTLLLLSVKCLSETTAANLAQIIVGKLDWFAAKQLGDGHTHVWCQCCRVVDTPEEFVPSPFGDDLGFFVRPITLQIAWLAPAA